MQTITIQPEKARQARDLVTMYRESAEDAGIAAGVAMDPGGLLVCRDRDAVVDFVAFLYDAVDGECAYDLTEEDEDLVDEIARRLDPELAR